MSKLVHFQRCQSRYEVAFLCIYFFINASILASSVLMEAQRKNTSNFRVWEPFVWEYSSALATLLLFPLIVIWIKKYPFKWHNILSYLLSFGFISVIFSLSHTTLMVFFRKIIYLTQTMNYDFGDLSFELFYEYRKDLWSLVGFVVAIKVYYYLICQLQGQAKPLPVGEDSATVKCYDRLLVKKLGKEFIIKVEDVKWLEAAGNYVNLHIKGRIYPLRATLSQLIQQLSSKGFCRIHRSYGINLECIATITPLPSGDSEILLHSGKRLRLSRRFKDSFKVLLKT